MRPVRVLLLTVVAVLVLVVAACSAAPEAGNRDESGPTTQVPQVNEATTVAPTATMATVGAAAVVRFDRREPGDVFGLVELWDGGLGAGFGSSLELPALLPDDARAAVPDGHGGVVYVTEDQVWWQRDPTAAAVVIEDPGIPVHLVGLRHVIGQPLALVLIGDKLIGYAHGVGDLGYVFEEFSGEISQLAVDGDLAVGIVADGDGATAVELVSMSTGERVELVPPVEAGGEGAPLAVALSGDRVAVLRRSRPVLVLTTDGSEVGTVGLGIEEMPVSSMDLAGNLLLVAFGEAATATDIVSGDRVVVSTPEGWVIGAVWAEPAALAEPPPKGQVTRFRVDTAKVEADVSDPFLNVRRGPGAQLDLYAKLPSTYTGLRWTGDEETADDGGIWYQVELLDPVHITPGEPLHGGTPLGWVNSAYLVPLPEGLPVTTAEVPACVDIQPTITSPAASRPPGHVYALESGYLSSRCLRIVLTFGTGTPPFSMEDASADLGPANTLPEVREHMSGGSGVVVDLGGIRSAWWGAIETADGVYVVRNGETLQLWSPIPIERSTVHGLSERGIVVVDLVVSRDREAPPTGPGVVLTRQPYAGMGSFEATGIARPFEGNLGVTIKDESGNTVEAIYSGSLYLGTIRTSSYAVQTNDWAEAWAPFAVRAEGLAPGDYTMVLDAQGVWDDPGTLLIPFTIPVPDLSGLPEWRLRFTEEPSLATPGEHEAVTSLIEFARGNPSASAVPFADEVSLGLNVVEERTLTREQLADPNAWKSDLEHFDGYEGDFSALATLARSGFVRITTGPMPHCAGPPLEWPASFDGLRQVNVEPIGGDSCLQWFGVSLFLDSSQEIEAVVLDLYGP